MNWRIRCAIASGIRQETRSLQSLVQVIELCVGDVDQKRNGLGHLFTVGRATDRPATRRPSCRCVTPFPPRIVEGPPNWYWHPRRVVRTHHNRTVTRRGFLLFAALGVAWGIPYLFIKIAVDELDPAMLVLSRSALAAVLLLPLAIFLPQRDKAVPPLLEAAAGVHGRRDHRLAHCRQNSLPSGSHSVTKRRAPAHSRVPRSDSPAHFLPAWTLRPRPDRTVVEDQSERRGTR